MTAVPITESWTGSDGAPWPAGWTITNGGATLRGNRGDLNIDGQGNVGTGAAHPAVLTDTDVALTFSMDRYGNGTDGWDSNLWFCARTGTARLKADASDVPNTGYGVRIYINPHAQANGDGTFVAWFIAELHRFPGDGTDPGKVPGDGGGFFYKPINPGVDYRMRLRVIGNRVQFRYWPLSEAEPVNEWIVDWTDPAPLPGGHFWIGTWTGWGGNSRGFRFDDLLITAPVRIWDGSTEQAAALRVV